MRDKVLRAMERYAEGGTICDAIAEQGIANLTFYKALDANPELADQYRRIQRYRADMNVDEAYSLTTDPGADPKGIRARAQIRLDIAKLFDRQRFGDRVDINVTGQVDLKPLIEAREARLLRPISDPAPAIDAEYAMIPTDSESHTPDSLSGSSDADDELPDIFGD